MDFVKGTSFMTVREWVTLHILWKAVPSHLFLWPTASEWHSRCCERQSHHIFSYDQQKVSAIADFLRDSISSYDEQLVSDIADFVKDSLMTSFPMTNSKWVTLDILWKAISSHLFLWPTDCEWHCSFCERQSYVTFFSMVNSKWVTLHRFVKHCPITFSY